ncbi:hypothetical protein L873DRAFT_1815085 [Choiromyces venosus 120613-1]|uniref:Uncharacterized protein n=1 Tax=Choiromyces venosus 120613-1 TaxID=1336337 RepID=A0A3N4J6P4_9PEZI|nr:hypothetical protein L873DRAFT_1815085 [Choiromyces venosus 120613-1]
MPETATPIQAKALDKLTELASILCQTPPHSHELSITNPIASEALEGYSVIIECGQGNIVWAVQMWANCSFRRIRRSEKIVKKCNSGIVDPNKEPKILLKTLQVWEGSVCDDIIKLHKLGQLKAEWWNHPVTLIDKDDEAKYLMEDETKKLLSSRSN